MDPTGARARHPATVQIGHRKHPADGAKPEQEPVLDHNDRRVLHRTRLRDLDSLSCVDIGTYASRVHASGSFEEAHTLGAASWLAECDLDQTIDKVLGCAQGKKASLALDLFKVPGSQTI